MRLSRLSWRKWRMTAEETILEMIHEANSARDKRDWATAAVRYRAVSRGPSAAHSSVRRRHR
jgi:hypothetical protein